MTPHRAMCYACLLSLSLFLTACGNATAADKSKNDLTPKPVTSADCLAMKVKEEKIACFETLTEQERVKQAQTKRDIETLKIENDKRRKRNEELLREFEKDVLNED